VNVVGGEIAAEDPRTPDVRALIEHHLEFSYANSPPEDVHALDIDELVGDDVTFFTFRVDGELLGMGALRMVDPTHAELKSMHTVAAARGRGIAAEMVERLVAEARARGVRRVSLETGTMDAYAPARRLYERYGFAYCGPFAEYVESPNSTFMTLVIDAW
jgi:putative acetyltransferase